MIYLTIHSNMLITVHCYCDEELVYLHDSENNVSRRNFNFCYGHPNWRLIATLSAKVRGTELQVSP